MRNYDLTGIRSQLAGWNSAIDKLLPLQPSPNETRRLLDDIIAREESHTDSIKETIEKSPSEVWDAVSILRNWMESHTIVRVIGAGRAKLAGSIPANRLAHGGARLFVVDDVIPMPHTYRAGGILAVSGSGQTQSVIDTLKTARANNSGIFVIGVAMHDAWTFASLCDIFIGIHICSKPNPLRALADTEEYVISRLLDAMVVAAGKQAGFDATTWKLGHENLGPTGPYDVTKTRYKSPLLCYNKFHLLGRDEYKKQILQFLEVNREADRPNVLVLTGALGIGKHRLLMESLAEAKAKLPALVPISVSAYWRKWDAILRRIAETFPHESILSETREDRVIKWAYKDPQVLSIDNIDGSEIMSSKNSEDGPALSFIRKWHTCTRSRLILTTTASSEAVKDVLGDCEIIALDGIKNEGFCDELLGTDVWELHTESSKLKRLIERGNPQELLYLRFLCDAGERDLNIPIGQLAESGKVVQDGLSGYAQSNLPLMPLLALGGLRSPVFPEELLRYIWDSMDCGGTDLYCRFLDKLKNLGFLAAIDIDRGQLRLLAPIHAELREGQILGLFPIKANEGIHFIGQFFRSRLAEGFRGGLVTAEAVTALEQYVYYSVVYGKIHEVVIHLEESGYLPQAFEHGKAESLIPILEHLRKGLKHDIIICSEDVQKEMALPKAGVASRRTAESELMLAQIEAEFGRVYKDLCQFEKSDHHLAEAMEHASKARTILPNHREAKHVEVESIVHHYQGIAYSQMGHSEKCLASYAAGVERAAKCNLMSARDVLSLGYLAYELKFHDINLALQLGTLSVEAASRLVKNIKDQSILVKNLCNLGQIQSFYKQFEPSKHTFAEAFKIHEQINGGQRELLRMYVNSAVTGILGDLEYARKQLRMADRLAKRPEADSRRKWMGTAYRGILEYKHGNIPEAVDLVGEALGEHIKLMAWREVLYEAYTLEFIAPKDDANIQRLVREAKSHAKTGLGQEFELFERFWNERYAPVLLGKKQAIAGAGESQ
jgi:D-arabinose 5-phosphate isomerase GutQ